MYIWIHNLSKPIKTYQLIKLVDAHSFTLSNLFSVWKYDTNKTTCSVFRQIL